MKKILLSLLLVGIFFDICDVFASSQVSGSTITITNDNIPANSPGYVHTRGTATKLSEGLQNVNLTSSKDSSGNNTTLSSYITRTDGSKTIVSNTINVNPNTCGAWTSNYFTTTRGLYKISFKTAIQTNKSVTFSAIYNAQ